MYRLFDSDRKNSRRINVDLKRAATQAKSITGEELFLRFHELAINARPVCAVKVTNSHIAIVDGHFAVNPTDPWADES